MTLLESTQFPSADANDSEAVVLAIETGRAFWDKGDVREAVRWVRRAAEQADEAGNDVRALALARAAADLTTLLQIPATMPPPPPPPPPPAPPASGWDEFQDKTIVDAPPGAIPPGGTPASRPPAHQPRPVATTVQSPIMQPGTVRPRSAVRVAVTAAADNTLSVRVLEEGQPLPEGAREALLVPLDPDTNFAAR